jgi:hypothetical protein
VTFHFDLRPDALVSEIRLVGSSGVVPFDRWALDAPEGLLPGVELAQRLIASESAISADDALLINSASIAGLTAAEAARLGLPPTAEVVARLASSGLMTQPKYRLSLEWTRPTGQPIVGAERMGAWLKFGGQLRRLPDVLYAIAEAVESVNGAGQRVEDKLVALAVLREALPAGAEEGLAHASGLIGTINIAIADSFSLDLRGDEGRLAPVLYGGGGNVEAPLLEAAQQDAFERSFNSASTGRPVYALSGQWYVVPQPLLRRALATIRRINGASAATRRAFLSNPRAFLREEIGDDAGAVVVDSVFRETQAYADRVLGLGLWQPRVVPWLPLAATDWLSFGSQEPKPPPKPPGLMVGDRHVPLDPRQAQDVASAVERAIAVGEPNVEVAAPDGPVNVPATHETLAALAKLEAARPRSDKVERQPKPDHVVLLIKPNEAEVEIEEEVRLRRPAPVLRPPSVLGTNLKPHQVEGLRWLQKAWTSGLPGVLLADDMGLGKTLQGLAFLAWLKEGMRAGVLRRAPLLVVAPTGLLMNWRAEHDRHLARGGLGRCTEAFGRGLAALKRRTAEGEPSLDEGALAEADWVLTTYETLRDYDRDFGKIGFAAGLFDEAQKIKTPGVRITDAAKAMKCEFRVALTGTPVENRLADLWCIMDGVHPGLLDDLKTFSERYEHELDAERLRRLKSTLERPLGGRPSIMLRRLKEDRLPELPDASVRSVKREMPAAQRDAYEAVLADARAADRPGAMLEALQKLRAVSLHPNPAASGPDEAFIASSARLSVAIETLDEIAAAREKALIFLEDLDLQAKLAGLLQRRYAMASSPALINGTVDGGKRQARVDAFQAYGDGFDAMILSPRAGGVGLTLTRANHVVHLSRWWNPAVEDQCNGRVHRIGQTKPIFIHLPLATLGGAASSFDENLDALLSRKRKLMRDTLIPPEATADEDRDELFKATIG